MQVLERIDALRAWRRGQSAGTRIGLVPTMGALHAGHLSLIERIRGHCDVVLASIFVNPAQFSPGEDLARYPRSLAQDCERLAGVGCDAVFTPSTTEIYPSGVANAVRVVVPAELSGILCGAFRPGHFDGVASVVVRLFHLSQSDVAIFGEKDYQQLLVIRRVARELFLPVEVLSAPTERAADGLALSSRNQYLDPEQRALAPRVYEALQRLAKDFRAGLPVAACEAEATRSLETSGFRVDYAVIRRASDLGPPEPGQCRHRGLVAAWLGPARLIDNLDLGA